MKTLKKKKLHIYDGFRYRPADWDSSFTRDALDQVKAVVAVAISRNLKEAINCANSSRSGEILVYAAVSRQTLSNGEAAAFMLLYNSQCRAN